MPLSRAQTRRIARECLGLRARVVNRVVSRLFDEALREHELKANQFTILTALAHGPGIRAVDLGEALELEKSSLSRNLAHMTERGWVTSGDEGLELTRAGQALLAAAYPDWKAAQARVHERLGARGADGLAAAASPLLS